MTNLSKIHLSVIGGVILYFIFFSSDYFARFAAICVLASAIFIYIQVYGSQIANKSWSTAVKGAVFSDRYIWLLEFVKSFETKVKKISSLLSLVSVVLIFVTTAVYIYDSGLLFDVVYPIPYVTVIKYFLLIATIIPALGLLFSKYYLFFVEKYKALYTHKTLGELAVADHSKGNIYFYVSGDMHNKYHLDFWRPLLEHYSDRIVLVVRGYPMLKCASELSNRIVYAPGVASANKLFPEKPAVMLYPAHYDPAVNLVRFNNMKHVFIGHGDSDKATSIRKYLETYDLHLVAGQAHVNRFRNAGFPALAKKARIIGAPYLHFSYQNKTKKKATITVAGAPKPKQKLLILTTWGGLNPAEVDSSIPFLLSMFKKNEDIFKHFKITLSPHPMNDRNAKDKKSLADLKKYLNSKGQRVSGDSKKEILDTDLVLMDTSGMNGDVIYLGIPFALTVPNRMTEQQFKDCRPHAKAGPVVSKSTTKLTDMLLKVVEDKRLATEREKLRRSVFGQMGADSLESFIKVIDQSIDELVVQANEK